MRRAAAILTVTVLAALVTVIGSAGAVLIPSPGTTELVSVGAAGPSRGPAVSADGRYVVFDSRDRLDPGLAASPYSQVFVRDLVAGTTTQLTVYLDADGRPTPGDGNSAAASISADGRFVAVQTAAGFGSYGDSSKVVRIDRDPDGDGTFGNTVALLLVSGVAAAYAPSIAGDGGTVVYEEAVGIAMATIGATVQRRPLIPTLGGLSPSNVWVPAVSGDGHRVVAMARYDTVGDAVVAFDLAAVASDGRVAATRLDVTTTGTPLGQHLGGNRPLLSTDGAAVVFEASVPLDDSEFPDYRTQAYLARAGTAPELLSRDNAGAAIAGIMPAISGDGRYAAFVTDAPNAHNGTDPVPGGTNCAVPRSPGILALAAASAPCQVVLRDLVLDAADPPRPAGELGSPGGCAAGCAANGVSKLPVLSGDGGVLAFESSSTDLVPGDGNAAVDVFARRFTPTVHADPIDFGAVQVGDESSVSTVVTATGFGPLVLDTVAVDGAGFTLGPHTCQVPVHVDESCAVSVTFAPTAEGAHSGTLRLTPRGAAPVPVPLRGKATAFPQPDPAFEVSPDPADFGERLVFTDSVPTVLTVHNGGARALVLAAVTVPPAAAAGDYRITADECAGRTLAAGASCTVTVVHQPQAPGPGPAVLQFEQETPSGPQPHLVQLLGAGITPSLQVNPAVVAVGRPTAVLGAGFPPNRPVSVTMPGYPELVSALPDADGRFTAVLVVYPNSVPGSRQVSAVVDGAATVGDTENLLVVPGSLGPPDFLARR